jgi:hypothetical protein
LLPVAVPVLLSLIVWLFAPSCSVELLPGAVPLLLSLSVWLSSAGGGEGEGADSPGTRAVTMALAAQPLCFDCLVEGGALATWLQVRCLFLPIQYNITPPPLQQNTPSLSTVVKAMSVPWPLGSSLHSTASTRMPPSPATAPGTSAAGPQPSQLALTAAVSTVGAASSETVTLPVPSAPAAAVRVSLSETSAGGLRRAISSAVSLAVVSPSSVFVLLFFEWV